MFIEFLLESVKLYSSIRVLSPIFLVNTKENGDMTVGKRSEIIMSDTKTFRTGSQVLFKHMNHCKENFEMNFLDTFLRKILHLFSVSVMLLP